MSALPQGWVATTLGEIVTLRGDKVDPASIPEKSFIGLEDIEPHTSAILRVGQASEVKSSVACFEAGDVLYSRLRPYLNKVARPDFPGVASAEILALKPSDAAEAEFVRRNIMTRGFLDFTAMLDKGDRPRVSYDEIAAFQLSLPPVPEQRRIVAKIDSLTGKSKRARDHLDHIPRLVEKYKQAILAAAFRGDLTREWRKKNDPEPLSATTVSHERRRLLEAHEQRLKQCDSISVVETDRPFKLPAGWNWVRAEAICGFITKGSTPGSKLMSPSDGEVPFIKVYNLTFDGTLDFSVDPTFVSNATHKGFLGRSKVLPGDVLMNIVGPPLGKVSVVPSQHAEWNINQAIAVFRAIPSVLPAYLSRWLLTDVLTRWAVSKSKATAGQSNLTLEICRNLPVPLCSYAEQVEIVRKIDTAMSWVNRLAGDANSAYKLINHLDQSVLVKAFKGELVPQDPADEPASVLLDRIRAERAAAPKVKRGRKKTA
ncbi:hypothetical protein [Sphingobium sp. DN12]|uniref:hypothetical protein n=1 Tax=Sphingobium sp. DN12 TaxID=3378073 RepID=UPI003DA2BB7F